MKQKIINGRWVLWTTDDIANWDGGTGDYTAGTGWEFERLQSMHRNLGYGDLLYDIGAEHGWLSALIAREFVHGNIVLFEPSAEMWVNIRKTWAYNGLPTPLAMWPGFVDGTSKNSVEGVEFWPDVADINAPEVGAMAYKSLANDVHRQFVPAVRLDHFASVTGLYPTALNIDVEGAELTVLNGADWLLSHPTSPLRKVWVSVHPDLMRRDFQADGADLLGFMQDRGWMTEFLGSDHEDHYFFTRPPL